MKLKFFILGFSIITVRHGIECNSTCNGESEKGLINDWVNAISCSYSSTVPPMINGNPAVIHLGLYPEGISQISIAKMTFELDLTLYIYWHDHRLKFPNKENTTLPTKLIHRIWKPKAFFANGIGSTRIKHKPDMDIYISDSSELSFHDRYHVSYYCEFDLSFYPMDIQRCELQIMADGSSKLVTVKELTYPHMESSLRGRTPSEYILPKVKRQACTKDESLIADRSCLGLVFIMQRSLSFHLIVTYFPSILLVMLSWVSFWLDVEASAPRVALGVTTLLTLATQFANSQKGLPAVSYVKAVDVWMFGCLFLVFSSLIEFALANYAYRSSTKKQEPSKPALRSSGLHYYYVDFTNNREIRNVNLSSKEDKLKSPKKTSKLDKISRAFFPFAFVLFNLIYWLFYLHLITFS